LLLFCRFGAIRIYNSLITTEVNMVAKIQSVSSVVWAAFRSGAFVGALVRPSRRSSSGWVACCAFQSLANARRFAQASGQRAGVACILRVTPRGRWSVSVPVSGPASGQTWSSGIVRGVRGVAAALRSWSVA
jgi:hypothetical protein